MTGATDGTALYANAWEALIAAATACKAPIYGSNRVHPTSKRMDGHGGFGIWTDPEHAELMAAGLRLTGFDVRVLPGYSVGVVIRDDHPPAPARPTREARDDHDKR